MNDANQTLEQMVTANADAAASFARFGLDFCCRGRRSLSEACAEAGLSVETVLGDLERRGADRPASDSWAARPLGELIDHILERYHRALREDLPVLIALAEKVEVAHATKPSCPVGLAEHLRRVRQAVESHLAKEEQILFPLIRAGRGGMAYMPIKAMMTEHEDHGQNLRRTRALTHDFFVPEAGCASWHELCRGLERLEADLFRHIHLENYVLFPRALETSRG